MVFEKTLKNICLYVIHFWRKCSRIKELFHTYTKCDHPRARAVIQSHYTFHRYGTTSAILFYRKKIIMEKPVEICWLSFSYYDFTKSFCFKTSNQIDSKSVSNSLFSFFWFLYNYDYSRNIKGFIYLITCINCIIWVLLFWFKSYKSKYLYHRKEIFLSNSIAKAIPFITNIILINLVFFFV